VTPLLSSSKNLPRWPVGPFSMPLRASCALRLRNRIIQLQESSSVHTVAASCSSVNTTLLENMATCTLQISIAMIQSHLYVPTILTQTSKNSIQSHLYVPTILTQTSKNSIQSVTQTLPTKEMYRTPRKKANSDAQEKASLPQHL
jgi:hypothetical protein